MIVKLIDSLTDRLGPAFHCTWTDVHESDFYINKTKFISALHHFGR